MPHSSTNPFTPDQPVTEEERFFGRDDVIEWVDDQLVAGEHLLVLFGTSRIGKTSLLFRLRTRLASRAFPVYVDLGTLQAPTVEMLWHVFSQGHAQLGQERESWPTLHHDAFVAKPGRLHSDLLPLWRKALRGRPLALLLDGLELSRLNEGPWAELVLRLREIVEQEPDIQVVATVAGASAEGEAPALHGLPQRDLEGLNEDRSEELLVGLSRFQLGFDYDALRRIHSWTGGHPYLLHVFGSELYRQLAPYGQVTIHTVGEIVPTVIRALEEPFFAPAWERLAREEQVTLAAIGSLPGYRGAVAPWDVVVLLRKYGVNKSVEEVDGSLQALCRVRILHWLGGAGYALRQELWRPWLAGAHSLGELLTGKRARRGVVTATGRGLSVDWGALLLYAGIGLAILLVARIWTTRRSPVVEPLATPTFAVSTPRPAPTRVVLPGKIAYMAQATAHEPWTIWIMRDDGSDPVCITDGTSEDTMPAWSPDGRRLAFVSNRTGDRDIWLMDADGTAQENMTRSPADEWTPAWSPDGESIAFASNRDGNWELYVAKADGSEARRLTWRAAADYAPSWSPDGSRLAFVSERDGNPQVYVVDLDGGDPQRLTEGEATNLSPHWSPDGSLIAFESYRDGNMEIYTMAPDGSDPRNLTNTDADEHGPAWSPDGKWITYYSNRDGSWDIFKMRADGEQKTNLTLGATIEQAPAWQPAPPEG